MNFDYDFTMGHNQGGFRGSKASDSKGYEYDMFAHVDNKKQNEEFKNKFIEYYEGFVKNIVPMSIINPIIKEFDEEISILIGYSISRWKGYLGGTKKEYLLEAILIYKNKTLQEIKKFLEERPKYTLENMKKYFKIE